MVNHRHLLTLFLLILATTADAEDWTMFRGPDRNGISTADRAPLRWGREKNVKWKAPRPRPGNSSPVVVGDPGLRHVPTKRGRHGPQPLLLQSGGWQAALGAFGPL